jgi:succinylarginine dihydrolase
MIAHEVNFDSLIGPTHSYAGLSHGNIASESHRGTTSNPRRAALQGLEKMRLLAGLGLKQAILPPHPRPDLSALRRLGFTGTDVQIIEKAHKTDPVLLASVYSSSFMWAANAATVSPSADTADGRLHITPANLISQFHRSLETQTTSRLLRAIFPDPAHFVIHEPLPSAGQFGDEGAANHSRLCAAHGEPGVEVFTFGRRAFDPDAPAPNRFPARQTLEASQSIARLHMFDPQRTLFVQQNPDAIDTGVFHNDVIAVANQNVFLYHEQAYLDTPGVIATLQRQFHATTGGELIPIRITSAELSLADAVRSYLFNSQLVSLPDGYMSLIAPAECHEQPAARRVLERITTEDNPIASIDYVDVRQSMKNGGGPACLRLRVVLNETELASTLPAIFYSDSLHQQLKQIIEQRYREELRPQDLADPKLIDESREATEAIWRVLDLGGLASVG